ncbi:hypothetical protein [uncultured Draconibacterium sp.]|uniref:hypothetical protein n=1 Tax=uncultured Draconibacterium sp. TaxID=1573823 RepID=UPI0032165504
MAQLSKEAAAQILFKEGVEQKEIAKILKLSETTISKYAVNGNWRAKRLSHTIKKSTAEEDALTALAHQSRIIRLIADKLGDELEAKNKGDVSVDDLKAALIPKGEIDALQKLFTTIKGKELDWSAIVRILREFSVFLKNDNIQLAQLIVPHIDKYINLKRKE